MTSSPPSSFKADSATVAIYHFDEGQGDVLKDSSGNGHHGKIVGAKWVNDGGDAKTNSSHGVGNYALQFEDVPKGTPRHIVKVPSLKESGKTLTMEVWVSEPPISNDKHRKQAVTANCHIVGFARHNIGGGNGTYGFKLGVIPDVDNGLVTINVPDEAMHFTGPVHLASVRDKEQGEYRFYLNGRLVDRRKIDLPLDGDFLTFGDGYAAFQGWIAEARISSVARYHEDFTPERRFPNERGTIALYHFDEGLGDVLKDSSGNDHHGTIVGAKWVRLDDYSDSVADSSSQSVRWPLEPSRPEDIAWLRELGATVTLRTGVDQDVDLMPDDKLPAAQATIVGVKFDPNEGEKITDEVLQRLGTLTNLERLELRFSGSATAVTKDGPSHLTSLVHLRHLELSNFGAPAGTDPSFVAALPRLEYLEMAYGPKFPWEEGVVRSTSLRHLFLYHMLPDNWEPFARMPRLNEVTLMGRKGTYEERQTAARQFATLAPWCRILVHDFSTDQTKWTIIEPTVPHPYTDHAESSEVDRKAADWVLSVGGVVTTEDGEIESQDELPDKPFRVIGINLAARKFDNEDMANLRGLTHIQTLNLHRTQTNAQGLAHVRDLKNLRELNLQFCKPTEDGFAMLKGLTNLRILNLSATEITNGALVHLKELKQLADLDLGFAKDVDDSGLIHLRGLTNLQAIGLGDTSVRDLPHINELKGLRYVGLKSTSVSAKGVQQLKDLPELIQLLITSAPLTDKDLMQFSEAKNLRVLYVEDTRVTAAGIAAFKKANPVVKVNSGFEKTKLLPQVVR